MIHQCWDCVPSQSCRSTAAPLFEEPTWTHLPPIPVIMPFGASAAPLAFTLAAGMSTVTVLPDTDIEPPEKTGGGPFRLALVALMFLYVAWNKSLSDAPAVRPTDMGKC